MENEKISIKFEKNLLHKIERFAELNELNRSEAIRNLVELGLHISKIKDHSESDMDEDILKMNIDMWLILAQLYRLFDRGEPDIESIKNDFSKKYRSIFKTKFKSVSERFDEYLKVKE